LLRKPALSLASTVSDDIPTPPDDDSPPKSTRKYPVHAKPNFDDFGPEIPRPQTPSPEKPENSRKKRRISED
jgi:hypothetical protein